MKLGTQTGSLVNHIYSRSAGATPEVGIGATMLSWSDRHAGTVIEVFTKGAYEYVTIQADNYKRIDNNGYSESQSYEYTPNPEGPLSYFRRKSDQHQWQGVYINPETGKFNKGLGGLILGEREEYYDFSF